MNIVDRQTLTIGLQTILGLGMFRVLPIAAALAVAPRAAWRMKAAAIALCLLIALTGHSAEALKPAALVGVCGYFVLGCWITHHWLTPALRAGALEQSAVFVVLAVAFLLMPGTVLRPFAVSYVLVGWEFLLKAFSYCVETSRAQASPHFKDCLFFILVDPTLVYVARSRHVSPPVLNFRGCGRILLGIVLAVLSAAVIFPALPFIEEKYRSWPIVWLFFFGIARFCAYYAAHAGHAHVQIGMMRQLGFIAPERYLLPILAHSPADFWRRWNTYVGGWLQRYVFYPLALRQETVLGLRVPRATLGKALAVFATFVVAGLLHDGFIYFNDFQFEAKGLTSFTVAGLCVIGWAVIARLIRRRLNFDVLAAQLAARGCFLVILVASAAYWR